MNSDGKAEVLVTRDPTERALLLGQGGEGLGPPTYHVSGNYPRRLVTADVDLDGTRDVGAANEDGGSISIFTNPGNAALAKKLELPANSAPRVTVADVNGDGRVDLVVPASSMNTVRVFLHGRP